MAMLCGKCRTKAGKCFSPSMMMVIFTVIVCVYWIDRGLIPGAPAEVGAFIDEDLHVGNKADTFSGILQSKAMQ